MIQTRAEAAGLVVQLQRTAVTQGLLFGGIAAVTGLSFMTAVIVWIAVAAPPSWRGWALGIVSVCIELYLEMRYEDGGGASNKVVCTATKARSPRPNAVLVKLSRRP